jgi:HPt (histidine-containing phosphotransfer) domain-containing protein
MGSDLEAVLGRFTQLEAQIGPEELGALVAVFTNSARSRLDGLEEAAADDDLARAADLAHSLAGSVGSYGGAALVDLLRDLERRCRGGIDGDALAAAVALVRATFSPILAALGDR